MGTRVYARACERVRARACVCVRVCIRVRVRVYARVHACTRASITVQGCFARARTQMMDPRGTGHVATPHFEEILRRHGGRLSDIDLFWLAARFRAPGAAGGTAPAPARVAYGPFAEWCRAPPRPPDHPPRVIGTIRRRAASSSLQVPGWPNPTWRHLIMRCTVLHSCYET